MLQVEDIAIAKGGDFDPMNPAICYGIDWLSFHAPKLIVKPGMEVVGPEFGKISC
jgi:hypothetical protein